MSKCVVSDEIVGKASVDALLAIIRAGISPDVTELLLYGDGRGTVAPGTLQKALKAGLSAVITDILIAEREREGAVG